MIPQKLSSIDEALLGEICAQSYPESSTLDFKRALPSRDERGRSEFIKDVCAFANADGGDLIFGIEEKNGCASILVPVVDEAADAAQRRLVQYLDAGVEPRVFGVQFWSVEIDGGYALVLRIPPSFNGPHRYKFNNSTRFVVRTGTLTSELSYDQLRMAFDRSATLTERARTFRQGRLDAIRDGKTWRPMLPGPVCVFHLIPLGSMTLRQTIDVGRLYHDFNSFMFPDWAGASRTLNLDGLLVHPGGKPSDPATAFVQVFRSGALEAVRYGGMLVSDEKAVPSTVVSSFIRAAVSKFLDALRAFDIGVKSAGSCRHRNPRYADRARRDSHRRGYDC